MPIIHSRLLLLGLIMVYHVYDMCYFLFPVAARGISHQFAHVDMIPLTHILIYIIYFGTAGELQFVVANGIHKNFLYTWYLAAIHDGQWRLTYQLTYHDGISTRQIAVAVYG